MLVLLIWRAVWLLVDLVLVLLVHLLRGCFSCGIVLGMVFVALWFGFVLSFCCLYFRFVLCVCVVRFILVGLLVCCFVDMSLYFVFWLFLLFTWVVFTFRLCMVGLLVFLCLPIRFVVLYFVCLIVCFVRLFCLVW